jgi:hypothetical protein
VSFVPFSCATSTGTLLTGETNAALLPQATSVEQYYYCFSVFLRLITGCSCSAVVTNAAEVTFNCFNTLPEPVVTQNLYVLNNT